LRSEFKREMRGKERQGERVLLSVRRRKRRRGERLLTYISSQRNRKMLTKSLVVVDIELVAKG